MKEKYIKSVNVNNLSYPGDQFKGCALIAVGGSGEGIQDVHYISKDVTEAGNHPNQHSWYVGVGHEGYGKDYQSTEDKDVDFSEGHEILYYYGEVDSVFQFDEVAPTYQNSFGTPTIYTVNWLNNDGSVIDSGEYYYGETPEYTGTTPERAAETYKYTFTSWSPEISVVIGDTDYTATYTKKKFFAGHSLTLEGDIGVCFYLDVPIADLSIDDVMKGKANGGHDLSIKFSWYNKNSEYKISTGSADFDTDKKSSLPSAMSPPRRWRTTSTPQHISTALSTPTNTTITA